MAVIMDFVRLISKLTFRRVFNLTLIYLSFYITRIGGKVIHWGKPFTISVEPTTSCNLRCPECPSGLRKFSRPTGTMSWELYEKIIHQASPEMFYLMLYFQGEPYLNPLFFRMTEYAYQKKIYTATSTNAHFLTDQQAKKTVDSKLDRLIISLDGTDQETFETYRVGGSYEKVIEGIKNLVRWKNELKSKTPFLILQFIVFKTNEHQIDDVKRLANDLGVDKLELKTAQVYEFESGNPLIPENGKYSRYRKIAQNHFVINNPLPNRCFRMWRGCVVTWDGLMVPCCFDKDADHRLGDLKMHRFEEIWKGPLYDDFRKKVFTSRKEIHICRNCTEK